MTECIVFLDESGDLGWKFSQPYRFGGSSRFLTISAVIVPINKSYLLTRAIKELYIKHNWDIKKEKKWSGMKPKEKLYFTKLLSDLSLEHNEIKFLSITAYKPKVLLHIRNDPNKLYNYMISLMLLNEIKTCSKIIFTPDPRNIKVECGHSLNDYLVTKLWFEHGSSVEFINRPRNSAANKGVQFTDMFSGLIQQFFENEDKSLSDLLPKHRIGVQTLYFKNNFIEVTEADKVVTVW